MEIQCAIVCIVMCMLMLVIENVKGGEEMCLLMKDNTEQAKIDGPTYLELGNFNIDDDTVISLDVLPDRSSPDGILFSVGTEGFKYYEWKTKSIFSQFFVIEITLASVSILLKALDQPRFYQLELYKTWPVAYNLLDGEWHHIRVRRDSIEMKWTLSLDDTVVKHADVMHRTDVFLNNRPVFIGGRPGYTNVQFKGILKNIRIGSQYYVPLTGPITGNAAVRPCDSSEVKQFMLEMLNPTPSQPPRRRRRPRVKKIRRRPRPRAS